MLRSMYLLTLQHVLLCKKVCALAKYSYVNDYKCGHKYALKYNSIEISSQICHIFS